MTYLSIHPIWIAAAVLLVPTSLFAMAGPIVVRRFVALQKLRSNNEIAGFKFATVGVIYAVLLAFAIVIVWERFNEAENDVAQEASAAATVLRLTQGLDDTHGAAVRAATVDYLNAAIARDWPAMAENRPSHAVTLKLTALYNVVLKSHAIERSETLIVGDILRKLDDLSDARRKRLVLSGGIVPGIIWMVLFVGAFLTVAFTFFFGTENLRAQVAMSGALAILIFGGLLTIVAIDHPFAGTFRVGPEPITALIEDFGNTAGQ